MPIVELPRAESPLTQGDILEGIKLFATKDGWTEGGGEAARGSHKMCLVLSRPCAVTHKPHVVVAGIEKYPDDVPRSIDDFAKVLSFLRGARDGHRAPDLFYLGQLPDRQGRFCARFDLLHTIQIPTEPEVMQRFLEEKRIATLLPDFARDLHCRLFSAFASLGFDDHSWPSTDDLEWLVAQGRTDIGKVELTVQELRAQRASRAAEGKTFSENDLTKAESKLTEIREAVTPFEAELERRKTEAQ